MFFKLGFSQQLELRISVKKSENELVVKNLPFVKIHKTLSKLKSEIQVIVDSLYQKGYLQSTLNSLHKKDNLYTAVFELRERINFVDIKYKTPINSVLLKKYAIQYNDSVLNIEWALVKPFLNSLIVDYEKKGKAFTQIRLKNIAIKSDVAFAELDITHNTKRNISKIIIKGYKDFPQSFVRHYLGLSPNSIFNTIKLQTASERVRSLAFVEEIKAPEVLFTESETNIYLYLRKKQTNSFDGLIGFTSKEQGSGVLLNGYLDINLNNAFNTGESLTLLYKSNGNIQQKFNLKASFPYAFKSKLTPSFDFNIYKQDTTFLNVGINIELQYPINFNSNVGLTISQESSSNLLKNPISDIQAYDAFYYGLSFNYKSFQNDILFNEKFSFNIRVLKGRKNIGLEKNNQEKVSITASYLWLLNDKNAFYLKNQSAILNTSNYVKNELFRIGGYNSIRGFDEESIFASNYSIINLEYRHKTNSNEYFYTVSDFAFYSNQLDNLNSNLYSFGLGYLFNSKIGKINLSYVLGKAKNTDFNLRNAKLHLNIISYF